MNLSDHNLIEISLKLNDTNYPRGGKSEEKQYYKLDDESLDKYIVQLELDTKNDITIDGKIEAPWVTEQIRIGN